MYIPIYIHTDHNGEYNLAKSFQTENTKKSAFFFLFFRFVFFFSPCVCVCLKLTAIYIFFLFFFLFLQSFLNIVQAGKTSLCTELQVCNCIVRSLILIIKFYFSSLLDHCSVCWVKAHRLFFLLFFACFSLKESHLSCGT